MVTAQAPSLLKSAACVCELGTCRILADGIMSALPCPGVFLAAPAPPSPGPVRATGYCRHKTCGLCWPPRRVAWSIPSAQGPRTPICYERASDRGSTGMVGVSEASGHVAHCEMPGRRTSVIRKRRIPCALSSPRDEGQRRNRWACGPRLGTKATP